MPIDVFFSVFSSCCCRRGRPIATARPPAHSEMEPLFCENIITLPSVLLCLFLPMSPPDQAFSTDIFETNAPFQKNILQAKKSHSSCIFQDATQSTLRIALPAEKESHDYSLSSFRWSSRFFSPSCSSLGGMQSDAATAHDSNGTLARNKREREREVLSLSSLFSSPLSLSFLSL